MLIALSVVAALSYDRDPQPVLVAGAVLVSAVVFWLAHVHTELTAGWISAGARPHRRQVVEAAWEQFPLVVAALPAIAALMAAEWGVYSVDTAVWVVMAVSLVLLAGWGLALARIARLGLVGGLVLALLNVGMGLIIVVLKVLISH